MTPATEQTSRKPLRLWPGVLAAVIVLVFRLVVPLVAPEASMYGVIAGVVGGITIVAWWLFFSRAPWPERVGAIVLTAVAIIATRLLIHRSVATGMMGMMLPIYALPLSLGPAFVAWAVCTRGLSASLRRGTMAATILLACGMWTLVRTNGLFGGGADLAWRWSPTAEEKLLAQASDAPKVLPSPTAPAEIAKEPLAATPAEDAEVPAPAKTKPAARAVTETPAEWPGFRGAGRDGIARGVQINTDWATSPPVEMWRRPIGPGWSSFAVHRGVLYTQEQRGDDEIVAAYKVSTGEPVWRHSNAVRFYESNGGAGPRGTPAVSSGRVYALGATGILNALDAGTGAFVWSRNPASDTGVKVPGWGFSSSPLVVGDLVVVAASGALVAYDRASGERRWLNPSRGGSYSSPHLLTVDGATQILMLDGKGAISVSPADGTVLWENAWAGVPIVQPAVMGAGELLISSADAMGGMGVRRLSVTHGSGGWTAQERWTSRGLKPYFNDYVVHNGHAFGFDGSILSCIDLADGTRKWKGGRYGQGQLVLLPDRDVLLVLSEDGELALVGATTGKFVELARSPALDGKTWNHPVLVGDVLLVRNGEEMAAFRMPLAGR